MKTTEWTYLAQLARAMQWEGVEGRIAGDFIAEIDAHLADSDLDPAEEFGPPAALARQVADREGARRRWTIRSPWLQMAAGLVLLVILVALIAGMGAGWSEPIEIPADSTVFALTIYGLSVGFGYLATRQLDGRSWSPLTGWRAWLIVGSVAVLGTTLSTVVGDRVLLTVPSTAVIVGLLVATPLLIGMVALAYNPLRFPENARHLEPLRKGLRADRFGGVPRHRPGERPEG